MRENVDQKNSEYEHFSHSDKHYGKPKMQNLVKHSFRLYFCKGHLQNVMPLYGDLLWR